jgi:hypothetical protein
MKSHFNVLVILVIQLVLGCESKLSVTVKKGPTSSRQCPETICVPASNLTWKETSPRNGLTTTAYWTAPQSKSPQWTLQRQNIQYFSDQDCKVARGTSRQLASVTTDTDTFTATAAGTVSFKISGTFFKDTQSVDVSSNCSSLMELNNPTSASTTSNPTISSIANQSTSVNLALSAVSFTLSASTTLACSGTYLSVDTSNTNLVDTSAVSWSGAYPSCSFTLTPKLNATGTATVGITVTDQNGRSARSSFILSVSTAFVLGQPNLSRSLQREHNLSSVAGATVVGGRFYASDYDYSRILVWNSVPTTSGTPADFVLGQLNLYRNDYNSSYVTSAEKLAGPSGLGTNGTNLIVADPDNNRVLIWNTAPTSERQAPDVVVGQSSFVGLSANGGGSASASVLNYPLNARVINSKLFIADTFNHRVLVWNSIPTSNGVSADFVIGQPNMTTVSSSCSANKFNQPNDIATDGTKLFISDSANNRVVAYNAIPTASNPTGDFVLGQSVILSCSANSGGISSSSLNFPKGLHASQSKIYVADSSNHRTLLWTSIPSSSFSAADYVLGQADFTSNAAASPPAGGQVLKNPSGVFEFNNKLFIFDSLNYRILGWNSPPTSNGVSADIVIGQSQLTSGTVFAYGPDTTHLGPYRFHYDGTHFIVADRAFHRVLIWNSLTTTYDAPADIVLGQSNFTNQISNAGGLSASSLYYPTGVYSDGTKLFVADSFNHRVLIWNTFPTVNNQAANVVLGQPNMTSNTANNGGRTGATLNSPATVGLCGSKLMVADASNNRVLVWNTVPSSSGTAANFVIGQTNLTLGSSATSSNGLSSPQDLFCSGSKLFVADASNHRVLIYNSIPTASNPNADLVLGQPNMTSSSSNNGGISASTLYNPNAVYSDGTSLFVSDTYNHRVLIWNSIPTVSTTAADTVYGQPSFTTGTYNLSGISATSIASPTSLQTIGSRLVINDGSNYRILFVDKP